MLKHAENTAARPRTLDFSALRRFQQPTGVYETVGLSIWANPITQHFRKGDQSVDPQGTDCPEA